MQSLGKLSDYNCQENDSIHNFHNSQWFIWLMMYTFKSAPINKEK